MYADIIYFDVVWRNNFKLTFNEMHMVAPKQETPNTIYKQNILGIFDLPFYIVGNGIH